MFSPALWKSLETYKEFVVNGLDLLSFLLVTQELIRLVQPALARATYYLGLAVATVLTGVLLAWLRSVPASGKLFF